MDTGLSMDIHRVIETTRVYNWGHDESSRDFPLLSAGMHCFTELKQTTVHRVKVII